MKKILTLVLSAILIVAMAVGVCAIDDAKASMYAAMLETFPEEYLSPYLSTIQSTLDQITVTEEQANEIITLMDEAKSVIVGTSSTSESGDEQGEAVTPDTQEQILDILDNSSLGEQVISAIDTAVSVAPSTNNGNAEIKQDQLIAIVNDACEILGLTAKIDAAAIATESTPAIKLDIYNEGKKITTIDNNPIKLTGGTKTTGVTPVVIASILLVIGLAGAVTLKKKEF